MVKKKICLKNKTYYIFKSVILYILLYVYLYTLMSINNTSILFCFSNKFD